MKTILTVFTRVFVAEFYRINAGFFFVATGLCFGFLSGREHVALAQAFVSSPFLLLIPIAIWLLYTLKVIGFNQLTFNRNENSFLYSSSTLSSLSLWRTLVSVTVGQFIPILLYGTFLLITALQLSQILVFCLIVMAMIFFVLLITWRLYHELINPNQGKSIGTIKSKFDAIIIKPFIWFYPEWIIRQQPIAVAGIKLFSCLLIIGISRLYLFDTYDERLVAMGCTLAFTSNLVLVFFYQRFENFHFAILRSLPFTISYRLGSFLLVMLLLNIPEIGILLNYFPDQLSLIHFLSIFIYGLSIYLMGYSSLFLKDITMDKFINKLFISAFIGILLILFKVPVSTLAAMLLIGGFIIYKKSFYLFEFNADTHSEK